MHVTHQTTAERLAISIFINIFSDFHFFFCFFLSPRYILLETYTTCIIHTCEIKNAVALPLDVVVFAVRIKFLCFMHIWHEGNGTLCNTFCIYEDNILPLEKARWHGQYYSSLHMGNMYGWIREYGRMAEPNAYHAKTWASQSLSSM